MSACTYYKEASGNRDAVQLMSTKMIAVEVDEDMERGEQGRRRRSLDYFGRGNCRGMASHMREYCDSTSLHGLRYMGDEKRPLIERICWIVAFGLSIMACGHLIYKIWRKWENTPVIVSFADSSTPVWQIPFPAVTICSEVKYLRSMYNFTYNNQMLEGGKEISNETRMKYEYKSLLCEEESVSNAAWETDSQAITFLQEVAPPCEDLFICSWKGKYKSCCGHFFRPILTDEGVCYTFNMLSTKQIFTNNLTIDGFDENYNISIPIDIPWTEWNAQEGYPRHAPQSTYPKRGPGAGASSGLHIYLMADPSEEDVRCRVIGGFKVLLHNPSEFPQMSQQFFRAPMSQDVVVSVKPNIMGTSKELQDYPSSRRRCLFQSERQLQFFTFYTQRNCELECLVNATIKHCNCMLFYMPNNGFPICGAGSLSCTRNISEHLQNLEITEAMKSISNQETNGVGCNCLPACTELNYDAETSMGTFDAEKIYKEFNVTDGKFVGRSIVKLSIFFKEWQFITSRRSELYGQTDFLANCGGLLGLCMGFSILSLVEIAYFFTLRLFYDLKGQKIKNKAMHRTGSIGTKQH